MAQGLLQAGADIEAAADNGQTALHTAFMFGKSVLQLLIDVGANSNGGDKSFYSHPLHNVVRVGCCHMAQPLIRAGAKIDQRTDLLDMYVPTTTTSDR